MATLKEKLDEVLGESEAAWTLYELERASKQYFSKEGNHEFDKVSLCAAANLFLRALKEEA